MTLQELYQKIGGDYEKVIHILRVEKLVDKHIRKFTKSGVVDAMLDAGKDLDPERLFETSHAVKGVCGNLGLVDMYNASSEISEEFRPGNPRKMSDDEVREKLGRISALYDNIAGEIRLYAGE